MTRPYEAIDIGNLPEEARLAEEVRQTQSPRGLRRGNEVIARIVPATPLRATLPGRRRGKQISEEGRAAFLASAGRWSAMDAEQIKADLYESREHSSRPPVEL